MSASVLECSHCGGPLRFQVPFCAYCRAAVTWGESLALERGDRLYAEHYPKSPLMGASLLGKNINLVPTPEGYVVQVGGVAALHARSKLKARDLCVAVTARTLDPDIGFAALARAHAESDITDAYLAVVLPGYRAVRLSRNLEGGGIAAANVITDWECSPYVAPVGVDNTIEIRCADSVIQLFVNGQRIHSVVDAGLGFGSFGWRVLSVGQPGKALFRGLEAYGVSSLRRAG